VVTHATDVEHPQASRSHLSPNLPAARGRGVLGATRGGLGTAPAFLHHPGQAGGARLRRRVDQAPYCSSWMVQKYRVGLEAAFWWHRN
jgi:hypothetical protein